MVKRSRTRGMSSGTSFNMGVDKDENVAVVKWTACVQLAIQV
jgi:hypothetical protein